MLAVMSFKASVEFVSVKLSVAFIDIPSFLHNSSTRTFVSGFYNYFLSLFKLAYDLPQFKGNCDSFWGGFDGGGSDNRPPKAVVPTGGPRACSPGKFFILGPLKCDFQRFQGKFEVI